MLTNSDYEGKTINQREDGFINLTQMCIANGKRIDNFLRLKQTTEYINVLANSLNCKVLISSCGGSDTGTWGHPKLAENLMTWLSLSKIRKNGKFFEISHQEKLWQEVGGRLEVSTKTGRIDILTDTFVIEVKDVKLWKSAVGQVLLYQLEYPNHKARIHLYGECSDDHKKMIISFCNQLNILATFTE